MKYYISFNEKTKIYTITCSNLFLDVNVDVHLNEDQFQRFKIWQSGNYNIQDILADLDIHEREILLTGMDEKEWNKMINYS